MKRPEVYSRAMGVCKHNGYAGSQNFWLSDGTPTMRTDEWCNLFFKSSKDIEEWQTTSYPVEFMTGYLDKHYGL